LCDDRQNGDRGGEKMNDDGRMNDDDAFYYLIVPEL
jgi:hypothetical protein